MGWVYLTWIENDLGWVDFESYVKLIYPLCPVITAECGTASNPMSTRVGFPGGKVAGVRS
jgi:hypothetical protein